MPFTCEFCDRERDAEAVEHYTVRLSSSPDLGAEGPHSSVHPGSTISAHAVTLLFACAKFHQTRPASPTYSPASDPALLRSCEMLTGCVVEHPA